MKDLKAFVGVVVVTYNDGGEIADCLKSIAEQATKDTRVQAVVVDNNSQDDSISIAKSYKAAVVANGKNLGFAKAVNIGVKKAYELGCDTILIFNPDAALLPGSLQAMLKVLRSSEDIGAVGPLMVHNDGSLANEGYYLKAPTLLTVTCFSTWLRPWALKHPSLVKKYEEGGLTDKSGQADVEQIPGACLLISKKDLQRIGLLDEDFAIWFEDVEWCYRARKMGYRLVFCPDAHVVHEGGVSFARWKGLQKAVTFYVSMKTYFKKCKPLSLPFVIIVLCLNAIVVYLKNHDKDQLRFIKHFLKQKTGTLPD
jgi:GT2 family glycosyltransferase